MTLTTTTNPELTRATALDVVLLEYTEISPRRADIVAALSPRAVVEDPDSPTHLICLTGALETGDAKTTHHIQGQLCQWCRRTSATIMAELTGASYTLLRRHAIEMSGLTPYVFTQQFEHVQDRWLEEAARQWADAMKVISR